MRSVFVAGAGVSQEFRRQLFIAAEEIRGWAVIFLNKPDASEPALFWMSIYAQQITATISGMLYEEPQPDPQPSPTPEPEPPTEP